MPTEKIIPQYLNNAVCFINTIKHLQILRSKKLGVFTQLFFGNTILFF